MRAREVLVQLRVLGFRAKLDGGALYFADTTGWQRDLSRFISPTLVFELLNPGLDADSTLLDLRRIRHEYDPGTMSDQQLRLCSEVPGRSQNIGVATPTYYVSPAEA